MKAKYELIDIAKFEEDVKRYVGLNDEKLYIFFNEIGLSDSVFSNARQNFKRGTGKFDVSEYEKYNSFGVIQRVYLNLICNKASINIDDYICKKKTAEIPTQQIISDIDMDFKNIVVAGIKDIRECNKTITSIIPDITELISKNNDGIARLLASLVKVGYQNRDILASISSDIKSLNEKISALGTVQVDSKDKLDKIASGIQTMNDKYNKPSAYIRK